MGVNSKNVFVGAPDQATTGAILTGPETDNIPDSIDLIDFDGLFDSGYVGEDGVTITPSDSTSSIKDWSGAEIRRLLTEFTGEIAWSHLELSAQAARNYFGDAQVTTEAATPSEGTRVRMALGKHELPVKSWWFKIKDGNRRAVVLAPHGQVSSRGEIPLNATAAIVLPVTLATYPDAAGNNIYIFTDDGVFAGSAPIEPTGVTPGEPGAFTPEGATPPANLAALQGLGALGETTAWEEGEYVVLGDSSSAHWDGDSWASGAAPA